MVCYKYLIETLIAKAKNISINRTRNVLLSGKEKHAITMYAAIPEYANMHLFFTE